MLRNGTASGKRVAVHMIVSKYSLPLAVGGRGPVQSNIILLNGSDTAGTQYNTIQYNTISSIAPSCWGNYLFCPVHT